MLGIILGNTELAMDDEPSMVHLFKLNLERLGYQVVGMTDSPSALEYFKSDPDQYDLVITDMAMPHMAGDELASRLLQIRPDLPILLCTGHFPKGRVWCFFDYNRVTIYRCGERE